MRCRSIAVCVALTLGCGGETPPKSPADEDPASTPEPDPADPSEQAEAPPEESAEPEPEPITLPPECAEGSSDPCLMPQKFVKALCSEAYPELALYLFAKDSAWTRAYVSARKVEPFNGHGGPSSTHNLVFDEELLILSERSPDLGGMSVSGVGKSYDVLRWDGTCATLQAGELRFRRPPRPKHAAIEWRRLDIEVRNALRADDEIKKLAKERRNECRGVTMGAVSAKCEKAVKGLRSRVVAVVRDGFQIPKPENRPK